MLRGGDVTTHMDGYNEKEAFVRDVEDPKQDNDVPANRETLNRLYNLSKPERGWLILSSVTMGFASAVQLTTPYITTNIIDAALIRKGGDDTDSPCKMLFSLFCVMALAALLTYMRAVWQARAGQRLVLRIRRELYAAILSQDADFFDRIKAGDLLSRLSNDADLQSFLDSAIGGLRGIVMSVGAACMLLYTSWSLALLSLAILPPTMTVARTVGRRMKERQAQVREFHAEATSTAEQAIVGLHTVQQFVAESFEAEKYNHSVHHAHYQSIETAKLKAAFLAIVQLVGNGSMMFVLGYGGSLVASGQLSAGELAGFVMYSLIMAGNVSALSSTWVELCKALASAQRVFQIIDRTPAIDAPSIVVSLVDDDLSSPDYQPPIPSKSSLARERHQMPLSVEFRNVSFQYPVRPEAPVLGPNFSLLIHSGEALALVGGSGAGKSTVAALLTRMYNVSDGGIYMDGVNIADMKPKVVRMNVGLVAQEPMLFPSSIKDNIRYGRQDATDEEVVEAARLANVLEFSDRFPERLNTVVGPRGTQLSGGQKQRVAVARAILKDPPIVIFDEATSALDAESEHLVQKAIDTAMKGRTVILIAHRLSTIRNADRIAVIQDGQVVEIGTFDELTAHQSGAFRELMKRQLV